MELVLGVVWTFWISVALVLGTVLLVAGILATYVMKVVVPKYPKR